MHPAVPLVILAPRGIFRVSYWIPSDASAICPCSHVRAFASDCRVMNSNPSFDRESSCREPDIAKDFKKHPILGPGTALIPFPYGCSYPAWMHRDIVPETKFTDWRCCRDEVASSVLCPWSGGVFDLSEAGFAAGAIACCSASISCTLEKCALEADGHACLSIETVALKACGSFERFRRRLHRGTSLSGPSLLKYRKKDPIGVLEEWRVGRDHSLVGDVTILVTFAAGGQGHALFVGAVACDFLWRGGWDSVSKFQGAGWEVFIVLIVVVQGSSCLLGSELAWLASCKHTERHAQGVSRMRAWARVYAIRISCWVGEVLVCWWTLSRRGQEAERGVPYQDDKKICFGLVNVNDILKTINKHASKQTESSPNPLDIPSGVAKLCAPEFNLVGARIREAYATRLGSIHLSEDAQRTNVRRSRHLPFYDPKVEGRQVTWV
ncbi:hypothetical protein CRG98_010253 [Punica granatum]|uniref:Uncharacterized protein n=1 Tax=Punica granatum TaxID=22663 RepID=A0A2I0KLG5_PUNGR|nr:hypothetical protein CRG98_010253 [Punica granatum]